MLKKYFLPLIIFLIYRVLSRTWRVHVQEPATLTENLKEKKVFLLAHWHGDELSLLFLAKKYRTATITSTSKDGEIMNSVFKWMGGVTSRGSSTRGGVTALKGLLRLLKSGYNSSFAVDGPKGPIYKIKPGIFEVARILQCPIYAGGVYVENSWRFNKSWNKTYLPKPFSKVVIVWSEAMECPSKEIDPRSLVLAESLEKKLWDSQTSARKLFDDLNIKC